MFLKIQTPSDVGIHLASNVLSVTSYHKKNDDDIYEYSVVIEQFEGKSYSYPTKSNEESNTAINNIILIHDR